MAQFIAIVHRDHDGHAPDDFTPELLELEAEGARTLYTADVVRSYWSRKDVPGAVLLIEAADEAAARAAVDTLPLRKRGMLALDMLVPLMPYRGFAPRG